LGKLGKLTIDFRLFEVSGLRVEGEAVEPFVPVLDVLGFAVLTNNNNKY
jgi:hypothetical protein